MEKSKTIFTNIKTTYPFYNVKKERIKDIGQDMIMIKKANGSRTLNNNSLIVIEFYKPIIKPEL